MFFPQVIIIDVNTLNILKTFCVYSGGSSLVAIKSIEVARRGSNFLINGSDRVLRVYDLENLKKEPSNDEEEEEEGWRKEEKGEGERGKGRKEIEVDPLQHLQDNVNRMQWKKCTFSGNGNNRFNIYIYISLIFASFIIMFVNYSLLFLSSVSPLFVAILLPFLLSSSLSLLH